MSIKARRPTSHKGTFMYVLFFFGPCLPWRALFYASYSQPRGAPPLTKYTLCEQFFTAVQWKSMKTVLRFKRNMNSYFTLIHFQVPRRFGFDLCTHYRFIIGKGETYPLSWNGTERNSFVTRNGEYFLHITLKISANLINSLVYKSSHIQRAYIII